MFFMAQFEPGKIINTVEGMPVKIVKYIAGGGQGDVYMVDYKGMSKALKWYKNVGKEPDAFYNNLKRNIEKGAPSESFLWPEAITEKTEGSFGYIMDLRPPEYHELSEFMIARDVRFSSFKAGKSPTIQSISSPPHPNEILFSRMIHRTYSNEWFTIFSPCNSSINSFRLYMP